MQISIDTSKDSHDDIRKAIALLQSLVAGAPMRTNSANIFENPLPGESAPAAAPASGSLFEMFDAAPQPAAPTEQKEEADEQPVVEFY